MAAKKKISPKAPGAKLSSGKASAGVSKKSRQLKQLKQLKQVKQGKQV